MDYEQKYKEALGWMQGMYGGLHGKTKEEAEHFFPELKESEDEKIRKAIIATIHLYYGEPLEDEAKDMIAWFEKQGEQKSMWTEEDEELLQHCCGAVTAADYYTMEDKEEMTNWLVSLKQRIGG